MVLVLTRDDLIIPFKDKNKSDIKINNFKDKKAIRRASVVIFRDTDDSLIYLKNRFY